MWDNLDVVLGLVELGITVGTLVLVVKTYYATRSNWSRREFIDRVNFSLNYMDGNTLKLRTLRESHIDDILLNNEHGKKIVVKTAQTTSLEKPFLEFPAEDQWMILNAILNELSEQFARGFLAQSMGTPVRGITYVFGLTCERDPRINMNKIRVMLIEKDLLEKIDEFEDEKMQYESPKHSVRLQTLKQMKQLWLDEQKRENLGQVELIIEA